MRCSDTAHPSAATQRTRPQRHSASVRSDTAHPSAAGRTPSCPRRAAGRGGLPRQRAGGDPLSLQSLGGTERHGCYAALRPPRVAQTGGSRLPRGAARRTGTSPAKPVRGCITSLLRSRPSSGSHRSRPSSGSHRSRPSSGSLSRPISALRLSADYSSSAVCEGRGPPLCMYVCVCV